MGKDTDKGEVKTLPPQAYYWPRRLRPRDLELSACEGSKAVSRIHITPMLFISVRG